LLGLFVFDFESILYSKGVTKMFRAMFAYLLMSSFLASLNFVSTTYAANARAPVAQTGQTKCYNTAGTEIACAGTGQDGDVRNGVPWPNPRFTDNENGEVADNLTGLIWTKDANLMVTRDPSLGYPLSDGRVDTQRARDFIITLDVENYLGHNDWRLPNRNELQSLVDLQNIYPALPTSHPFINVPPSYSFYWSSSTWANNHDAVGHVFMDDGGFIFSNNGFGHVWAVRTGQASSFSNTPLPKTGQTTSYATGDDGDLQTGIAWPIPRFSDNGDQTILDNLTGLVWSKDANTPGPEACGPGTSKSWQDALDYVKCINNNMYLGYNDWVLPNKKELSSLINIQELSLLTWLTNQGFTNVQGTYWSSSTRANSTTSVWQLSTETNDGDSSYYLPKEASYGPFVWPVRAGQHWSFDTWRIKAVPQFGTVPTGTIRQEIISILSRSPNSISSITINGSNAAEFTITLGGSNSCSSISPALATGASCTLILEFKPTSSGAKNASLDITTNGTTNSIPLTGTALSTVYGTVTDQATGLPVSGATVTLNTSATAITRTNGDYNFSNLPASTYSISVVKTGYQTTTKNNLMVNATVSAKADILLPSTGTLNITTNSLPWASPNIFYNSRVMVAGGTAPYTFSKAYGSLPTGLSLDSATGIISGTPTGSGSYTFAVGVTDSVAGYSEKEFTLDLVDPLLITTATVPSGQQGFAYNTAISASGGKPSYSFTLNSGSLPNGITLETYGVLSGTPRESGSFSIALRVTDSTGRTYDKQYILILSAATALALSTTTLPSGFIGNYYSTMLSASGGVTPLTYSVTGALPESLWLDSSIGIIGGIPSSAGLTNLTFIVTDNSYPTPQTVSKTLPLRIWSTQPYTFSVTMAGNGAGKVTSDSGGMACTSGTCSAELPSNTTVNLLATPSTISLFDAWSGDCSGSGGCSFTLTANKSVTATYNLAPKAMIGVTEYSSFAEAYSAASGSSTTILLLEDILPVSTVISKSLTLMGGYLPNFSRSTSGYTTLQGTLAISSGSLLVDRVVVK
jgi:hypothetical protein